VRALHQVVARSADVRRGAAVFVGSKVPVRALIEHLDKGGDVDGFLARQLTVSREVVLAACALGLEALVTQAPLEPVAAQRSLLPRLDRAGVIVNAEELSAGLVVGKRVLCPACRTLRFRSWPEGWDSHAATRCRGLSGSEPRARKSEYKRRYGHLFR
jgi:uncharacterized protein (DUF433 family)